MSWVSSAVWGCRGWPALLASSVVRSVSWVLWYVAVRNEKVAVFGSTSVAEDVVVPRFVKVPKWLSATISGQRSAAQNGQDSSPTKTMAGLPLMVSGAAGVLTGSRAVATCPVPARARAAAGTDVTWLTTAADAGDSVAAAMAGLAVSLIPTSAAAMPTTAV